MTNAVDSQQLFSGKASSTTSEWEPFLIDGEGFGEVHILRGSEEGYLTGFYRITEPTSFDYPIEHDKTVYVIEGKMKIEVEGGETLVVAAGEMASFAVGLNTHWEVLELPYHEVFVQS
jgi:uncharacterized cupin superfamily protein